MKFYILQFLKPTDPNLGEQIYNNIKDLAVSEFFKLNSEQDLYNTLDYIKLDLATNKELKGTIHFHCHGNESGIGIFSEEGKLKFISWEDLRQKFREIYVSTSIKPLLSMCSCEGFNVSKLVPHFEPCPFDYISGSFKTVEFQLSIDGYSNFYKTIIEGKTLQESIIETRAKYPELDFACLSANQLFNIAIDGYKNLEMVPEKIAPRRHAIEQIVIQHFGLINQQQKDYLDYVFSTEGTDEQLEKFRRIFFS